MADKRPKKTTDDEDPPSLADAGLHVLFDEITLESAKAFTEFVLEANLKPSKEAPPHLNLLINSEGGDVFACFAIVDAMRGSRIPVHTTGLGLIASSGLIIFMAGAKGHRVVTPNTSILSHQYSSWGGGGKHHELLAMQKHHTLLHKLLLNHYKLCTGLTEKQITKSLLPPEDVWLTPDEAVDLGVADEVRRM